jgi:mRNA interferase RelE/StbE
LKIFELEFGRSAFKEWRKLAPAVRNQFARKLKQRLVGPRLPASALRDLPDCYKIKLKDLGYRLVYRVYDDRIVVQVIAVGKRDKNAVYKAAAGRLDPL